MFSGCIYTSTPLEAFEHVLKWLLDTGKYKECHDWGLRTGAKWRWVGSKDHEMRPHCDVHKSIYLFFRLGRAGTARHLEDEVIRLSWRHPSLELHCKNHNGGGVGIRKQNNTSLYFAYVCIGLKYFVHLTMGLSR